MAWMHPHSSRLGGWHVVSCPGAPGLPAVWRRWPGLHPHGSDVLASWRSWPSKLCRTSSIMSCSSASACVCVCVSGWYPSGLMRSRLHPIRSGPGAACSWPCVVGRGARARACDMSCAPSRAVRLLCQALKMHSIQPHCMCCFFNSSRACVCTCVSTGFKPPASQQLETAGLG